MKHKRPTAPADSQQPSELEKVAAKVAEPAEAVVANRANIEETIEGEGPVVETPREALDSAVKACRGAAVATSRFKTLMLLAPMLAIALAASVAEAKPGGLWQVEKKGGGGGGGGDPVPTLSNEAFVHAVSTIFSGMDKTTLLTNPEGGCAVVMADDVPVAFELPVKPISGKPPFEMAGGRDDPEVPDVEVKDAEDYTGSSTEPGARQPKAAAVLQLNPVKDKKIGTTMSASPAGLEQIEDCAKKGGADPSWTRDQFIKNTWGLPPGALKMLGGTPLSRHAPAPREGDVDEALRFWEKMLDEGKLKIAEGGEKSEKNDGGVDFSWATEMAGLLLKYLGPLFVMGGMTRKFILQVKGRSELGRLWSIPPAALALLYESGFIHAGLGATALATAIPAAAWIAMKATRLPPSIRSIRRQLGGGGGAP